MRWLGLALVFWIAAPLAAAQGPCDSATVLVLADGGRPVKGAHVGLHRIYRDSVATEPRYEQTTDAGGRAVFDGAGVGAYAVEIRDGATTGRAWLVCHSAARTRIEVWLGAADR